MTPFRTERLVNGVVAEFIDRSNRYFGDYHRVCIEVRLMASVPDAASGEGTSLQTVKVLERMGVPGIAVEATRNRLADDYWRHAGSYLAHPDYPARLAASQNKGAKRRLTDFRPQC